MDTAVQIILFFLLVAEGAATRALYNVVLKLQKKIGGKPFAVVSDVLTAVIGAGVMLISCLLLADSVRVFYAVFYIGGIALAHLLMSPHSKERKERRKKEKAEKAEKVGKTGKRNRFLRKAD